MGDDSEGQSIARCYDLPPAQPVMEDKNGRTTIFQSGNKFYLWSRMCDGVEETVFQDIHEIASVIAQSQLTQLATVPFDQIRP